MFRRPGFSEARASPHLTSWLTIISKPWCCFHSIHAGASHIVRVPPDVNRFKVQTSASVFCNSTTTDGQRLAVYHRVFWRCNAPWQRSQTKRSPSSALCIVCSVGITSHPRLTCGLQELGWIETHDDPQQQQQQQQPDVRQCTLVVARNGASARQRDECQVRSPTGTLRNVDRKPSLTASLDLCARPRASE